MNQLYEIQLPTEGEGSAYVVILGGPYVRINLDIDDFEVSLHREDGETVSSCWADKDELSNVFRDETIVLSMNPDDPPWIFVNHYSTTDTHIQIELAFGATVLIDFLNDEICATLCDAYDEHGVFEYCFETPETLFLSDATLYKSIVKTERPSIAIDNIRVDDPDPDRVLSKDSQPLPVIVECRIDDTEISYDVSHKPGAYDLVVLLERDREKAFEKALNMVSRFRDMMPTC